MDFHRGDVEQKIVDIYEGAYNQKEYDMQFDKNELLSILSLWVEVLRSFLALDQSPLRRPERGLAIRMSTETDETAEGVAEARGRMRSFLPLALAEIGRVQADRK